jgi:hypothetical protein
MVIVGFDVQGEKEVGFEGCTVDGRCREGWCE